MTDSPRYGPPLTQRPAAPIFIRYDVGGDWAQVYLHGDFAFEGHGTDILLLDEFLTRLSKRDHQSYDIRVGDIVLDTSWKAVRT